MKKHFSHLLTLTAITTAGPPGSRLSGENPYSIKSCNVHDGTGINHIGGGHHGNDTAVRNSHPATLAKDPRLPEPSGELESIAYTNFNAAGIPPPRRRALSHDMADLLPGFIASKGFGAGVTLRA